MPTPSSTTIHPDLTMERLIAVARLIARGRNDALERFDIEAGDDGWTLGCRAFQFSRHRVLEAADDDTLPWLTIIDGSRQFVFRIGEVPVRFYRGPSDEPTSRTLHQSYPELAQLAIIFPDEREAFTFRFAVETDFDGAITGVKFVALQGATVVHVWDIPIGETVTMLRPVKAAPAEGVDLPPPEVRIPGESKDEERGPA